MNKKTLINLVMFIIITFICLASATDQQSSDKKLLVDLEQYINALHSNNEQERDKANITIRNNYDQIVNKLIKLVEVKLEPEPSIEVQKKGIGKYYAKEQAIMLLGDLRAAKAVPVLMENLEFENPFILGQISYTSIGNNYKVAAALVKIGMPAVEPALDRLRNYERYKKESEICCFILPKILGYKLAAARIQIAIDETKDESVKKKLREALNFIETRYSNTK